MNINEVYEKIAESSIYGNLGLFIGAGFSKDVCKSGTALSWIHLLQRVASANSVDWNTLEKEYKSCPEIASIICKKIETLNGITFPEAEKIVKEEIARQCIWFPTQEKLQVGTALLHLAPKWIITTNYDLVLETLLADDSESLGPNHSLVISNNKIPIYHLHGIRSNPPSLVVTNEDYTKLFRPHDYRLQKLSLTLKESTTVIFGYGIGDPNVLTALDWSRNVYQYHVAHYPNGVIQFLYTTHPSSVVKVTSEGMILIETDSIQESINSIIKVIESKKAEHLKSKSDILKIRDSLKNADEKYIEQFIDDAKFRNKLIKWFAANQESVVNSFVTFLLRVYEKCWERARPKYAFHAYDEMISIILDIITKIELNKMAPSLFECVASFLDRVSYYVARETGKSYDAFRTWESRCQDIPEDMKEEILNYARSYNSNNIATLFGYNIFELVKH